MFVHTVQEARVAGFSSCGCGFPRILVVIRRRIQNQPGHGIPTHKQSLPGTDPPNLLPVFSSDAPKRCSDSLGNGVAAAKFFLATDTRALNAC